MRREAVEAVDLSQPVAALKDPDNEIYITSPEAFAASMSDLGIAAATTVVGYDG